MTNPLSFVVILFSRKSKPLYVPIQVLRVRKTRGGAIVYYSPGSRKFRITVGFDAPPNEKKHILRVHFITNTINDGQQNNRHREIL